MKNFVINVLARIGSYCCRKSIELAGNGDLKFEVFTNQKFNVQLRIRRSKPKILGKILGTVILVAILWSSALIIAYSIKQGASAVVNELRYEHNREILHVSR